jgi:hypothetical protein
LRLVPIALSLGAPIAGAAAAQRGSVALPFVAGETQTYLVLLEPQVSASDAASLIAAAYGSLVYG